MRSWAGRTALWATLYGGTGCVDMVGRLGGVALPTGEWCDDPRDALVACAVDGDTVDLDACGDGERVRLLGVAAPEVAHGAETAQCYGDEASAFLAELVEGETLRLEFDQDCTDIYGRTLAWLWMEGDDPSVVRLLEDLDGYGLRSDGSYEVLVNVLLVRAGYAEVYDKDFALDVRFIDELEDAEDDAADEGLGLWSECQR
jgi:endonuclease YncB( thermonuclease family)